MPSPVEVAADTYIRAWGEPDPARRAALVESCFAADGRIVTRSRVIEGRAGLVAEMERVFADPRVSRVRVNSAIDAAGTTFRFFGIVEFNDGTSAEAFDAGQIDAAGQIALILTFAGRLGEPGAAPAQPLPGR